MEHKHIVLHTGIKGAYNFDTEMIIGTATDMNEEFRKCRDKLYDANSELSKIKRNIIVKTLLKLKIIRT